MAVMTLIPVQGEASDKMLQSPLLPKYKEASTLWLPVGCWLNAASHLVTKLGCTAPEVSAVCTIEGAVGAPSCTASCAMCEHATTSIADYLFAFLPHANWIKCVCVRVLSVRRSPLQIFVVSVCARPTLTTRT